MKESGDNGKKLKEQLDEMEVKHEKLVKKSKAFRILADKKLEEKVKSLTQKFNETITTLTSKLTECTETVHKENRTRSLFLMTLVPRSFTVLQ